MKKNLFLKKSLFVLLYIFSFLLSGFSQILVNENYKSLSENQKQEKRDSIINNSDYILYGAFAGELVIFTDENKKDIYRITRIYVRDVIRGPQELKNTHIYSISKVYGMKFNEEALYNQFQQIHEYLWPEYYNFVELGYFFCKKNTMSLKYLTDSSYIHPDYLNYELFHKTLEYDIESSFICESTSNLVQGIAIDDWNNKTYKGLYGLNFANREEVINYLLPYGNITNPNDTTASEKKLDSSLLKSGSKKSITPEETENFNLWLQGNVHRNITDKSLLKSNPAIVDCEFSTENQHIVYDDVDDKFYFEFDLAIEYSSSDISMVYPDNVLLYFKYNTSAFGTNIVSQGKMTTTINNSVFNTSDYELVSIDHIQNNNQALIRLTALYENLGYYDDEYHFRANRTAIAVGEKVGIGKVRIEFPASILQIDDVNFRKVGISELWNMLDLNVNLWSDSQDCYGCFDLVNETTLHINNSYILGNVYIDRVYAKNGGIITGGNNCEVVIEGSGFMNSALGLNSSFIPPVVLMRNAHGQRAINDGSISFPYVPIDYSDITLWTDTRIEFIMPSVVKGISPFSNVPVGTGTLQVRNQVEFIGNSPQPITVEYSIMNTYDGQGWIIPDKSETLSLINKQPTYWSQYNCNEQILFTAHNSISDNHIKLFEEAFSHWNSALGFSFFGFKRDANGAIARTELTTTIDDDINLIYYDSNADGLAAVETRVIIGGMGVPPEKEFLEYCGGKYSRTEIDFYLNSTMLVGQSNSYIRQVIMHELGHGLGLSHVINPNDLMHPFIDFERIIYTITPSSKNGANQIFDNSRNVSWESICSNIQPIFNEQHICLPQTPAFIRATAPSKTEILIEWLPDNLATSYIIESSLNEDMSNSQIISIDDGTVNSFLHTGLTSNTNYYYRIKSNNLNGSSGFSYIVTDKTKLITILNSTQNVSVENDNSDIIIIEWEDNTTDELYYIIERQEETELKSLSEFYVVGVVDANLTEFFDYNIEEGVTYNYRIKYVTLNGESSYSEIISVTPGEFNEHNLIIPIHRSALLYKNSVPSLSYVENTNFNNYPNFQAWRWTHSGYPTYMRSVFDFDLSQIPEDAIIVEAVLDLKGNGHMNNITQNNTAYKSNSSWLEIITEPWNESQVTWNTQPSSSSTYRVALSNSNSTNENYEIDVKDLIIKMIQDPSNTHGLMLRLQNELAYTRIIFGAQSNTNVSLQPFLKIRYITVPEKVIQINPQNDAIVYYSANPNSQANANSYYGDNGILYAEAWTSAGYNYFIRGLINFDLENIPSTATITTAELNLYSPRPQNSVLEKHYSTYSTGSSVYKSNASYLKRIVTDWNENQVTWNNQPQTISTNQVSLSQSTAYSQDYLNLNIKNLIQDMVHKPDSSFGLMLMLQSETKYARMSFASCDHSDVSIRPQVLVSYKVYPLLLKSYNSTVTIKEYNSSNYLEVQTNREFIDSVSINKFFISPNPTKDISVINFVDLTDEIEVVKIYSSSAILVDEIFIQEKQIKNISIDFSKYSTGTYVIHVLTKSGNVITEKVVYH